MQTPTNTFYCPPASEAESFADRSISSNSMSVAASAGNNCNASTAKRIRDVDLWEEGSDLVNKRSYNKEPFIPFALSSATPNKFVPLVLVLVLLLCFLVY
eukprot:TRINITY_DN2758_c0_g2_i3.p1 TRINITY_DN2758_c0_g2~~TRINITY_DN2758_c0_g2_i3.p1  ORF type:complete len:100 (+),score=18.76 TRINITY_DN2758_c0_g2_i3:237-536(+)